MARNDTILLDGIIDQRVLEQLPSTDRGEAFELFAVEQILKDFDLSREELDQGLVDGRDDGGIDGWFLFVNGHLVTDLETLVWPKKNVAVELYLITCKHHETFQQTAINSLLATVSEILDLRVDDSALSGTYNENILESRSVLRTSYIRLAHLRPSIQIRFIYASRGDASNVGDNVRTRGNQVAETIKNTFSSCSTSFEFVGASELVEMHRRMKNFTISLPYLECIARAQASYVLLVTLADYFRFVRDDDTGLRRYLFDSNVRDYMGSTQVNEGILETLQDATSPDFWWLNNGVTILTTGSQLVGKTMQMENIQIVNGLQTTETIFRHFNSQGARFDSSRALLVKVLVSDDQGVRDRIIRATNSQTVVEVAALRATDKVQRDIESILGKSNWYYERRKNYYKNVGQPASRFVTPLYAAAGYVALVMKNPAVASSLKNRFMRNESAYALVFSGETSLEVWPQIVELVKRAEDGLRAIRAATGPKGERFLARWRNLVALLAVGKMLHTFSYSVKSLIDLDPSCVTLQMVTSIWALVEQNVGPSKQNLTPGEVQDVCATVATAYNIAGTAVLGRQHLPSSPIQIFDLTPNFVTDVDRMLPEQPWPIGTHATVANTLGCKPAKVQQAIQQLIVEGRRYRQWSGIAYDQSGRIVAVDPSRADAERLENGPAAVVNKPDT